MYKTYPFIIALTFILILSSCSGIKYLTVETREPAQVTLPQDVLRVAVVNNVVQQPDEIGHNSVSLGSTVVNSAEASADSVSVFYTEALAQFINEENYFNRVTYYNIPIRSDKDFFQEILLDPKKMNEIRKVTGVDAIISLDRLIIETIKREHFKQQGYTYSAMNGKINSTIRVYLPTLEGKIPRVQFTDSLHWVGFDIQDGRAYSQEMLPSREEAMKSLAIMAAEKMTYVFTPHWERQDRWYYTSVSKLMREGAAFAKSAEWLKAIAKWEEHYNNVSDRKKTNKAKVANNIALAYEMLGEMEEAHKWATEANDLFVESTAPNSLERRRSLLYKNEIARRNKTLNSINMQDN
jgi:hypothetical protein